MSDSKDRFNHLNAIGQDNILPFRQSPAMYEDRIEELKTKVLDLELELTYARQEIQKLRGRSLIQRLLGQ